MRRLIVLLKNIASLPYRFFRTRTSIFAITQDSKIHPTSAVCSGVKFYRSEIGRYCTLGRGCFVTNTRIGDFTSFGGQIVVGGTSHPIEWVSSSSVFHKWSNLLHKHFARFDFDIFQETTIGSDVWIGDRCMIRAGVSIGHGAVIGMGSIVTKDVGPYEVWAGNPAKKIRDRFEPEIIRELLDIKWWEWDDAKIEQHAKFFNDPRAFIDAVRKNEAN